MSRGNQNRRSRNREGDSNSTTPPTPTETTTLLDSETSSRTLEDGDGFPEASLGSDHPGADMDTDTDADSYAPKQSIGRARAVAVILSSWALIFLQASNMSGMAMAQSAIAEELKAYEDAMWFTTAYLISTSALSPLAGRLATIFSPRSLALPIALFFAAGGLVTAAARSFAVFLLGRVLAGAGGAGIMTLSVILVLELTGKKNRGLFIGLVNCGFTVGLSSGAVVYGALLEATGWRFLFGIQAPLALVAGLGVFLSTPRSMSNAQGDSDERTIWQKLARIDYGGAIMLVLAIVLFLYGLSGDVKWAPIVLSIGALFVFVSLEVFVASDPIIPLSVLSSRGVLLACVTQLGFITARWTLLFYGPVFVLAVRAWSPAAAGSIIIPTNVGFGAGGLLVGWLHVRRAGAFWAPSLVALAVFGATLASLSAVGAPESPIWAFVLIVVLNGLATGAAVNYTLAHLLHLSRPEEHFIATSLMGTFRGFGGSFGTAIGGGVFYRLLRGGLVEGFAGIGDGGLTDERRALIHRLVGSPALVFGGELSDAERHVAVESYAGASRGTWQAAAALMLLALVLQAAAGQDRPRDKMDDEAEARARLLESEGVGEA